MFVQTQVVGVQVWRGAELEGALHASPHVLTALCRIGLEDGGECRVYPLAEESLTDAVTSRRLHGLEMLETLLQVTRVHESALAYALECGGYSCVSIMMLRCVVLPRSPCPHNFTGIRRHRRYP